MSLTESFDSELDGLAAGLTKMECSPVRRHAARRRTAHFGQVTPGDVGESPGQIFFSTPERAASPEAMMDMHEAQCLPEAPVPVHPHAGALRAELQNGVRDAHPLKYALPATPRGQIKYAVLGDDVPTSGGFSLFDTEPMTPTTKRMCDDMESYAIEDEDEGFSFDEEPVTPGTKRLGAFVIDDEEPDSPAGVEAFLEPLSPTKKTRFKRRGAPLLSLHKLPILIF